MKKISFLLIVSLFLFSCKNNPNEFIIEGIIENAKDNTIYLHKVTETGIEPMDSATIDAKGIFLLKQETDHDDFFTLRLKNSTPVFLVIGQGNIMKFNSNTESFSTEYTVEGSIDSEYIRQLAAHLKQTRNAIDSLNTIFLTEKNNADNDSIAIDSIYTVLSNKNYKIIEQERQFTIDFITKNPSSLASYLAISQPVSKNKNVLNFENDFKYIAMVDSALLARYPKLSHITFLHEHILRFKKMARIGSNAPDIVLPDTEDKILTLSSLKGKYVLLDFWASWCKPCRTENPNLVKIYNKFKDKEFEIFQVSLDEAKPAWIAAIEKDKLDWLHVSELTGWESEAAKIYGVQGIPSNFLIDKSGKIIEKNLVGENLELKLNEIFDIN